MAGFDLEKPGQKRILGKTPAYWRNWFYYSRWTILASAAGLALLIYLIATMATNRPADFKIVLLGDFTLDSGPQAPSYEEIVAAFEQQALQALQPAHPEIRKVSFEMLQLAYQPDGTLADTADPQYQQASLMKAMALLSADSIDVLLLSRGAYAAYASQTDFPDLAPLSEALQAALPPSLSAALVPLDRHPADSSLRTITGLDVTALNPLQKMGLRGDSLVVTIGPRSQKADLAKEWLQAWLQTAATVSTPAR
jgi:hypothetical protein